MYEMDYEQRLNFCCERMALDYSISEKTAGHIIYDFDIEDIVFHHYSDEIETAEQEKQNELEAEQKLNPELYDPNYNIHGGV